MSYLPVVPRAGSCEDAEAADLSYYWGTRGGQQLAEIYQDSQRLEKKTAWVIGMHLEQGIILIWGLATLLLGQVAAIDCLTRKQRHKIFIIFYLNPFLQVMGLTGTSFRKDRVEGEVMYVRIYRMCLRTQRQDCNWISCRTAIRT